MAQAKKPTPRTNAPPAKPCNQGNSAESKRKPKLRDASYYELADPDFYKPGEVDTILGTTVMALLLTDGMDMLQSGPIVHRTLVGFTVFGGVSEPNACCLLNYQSPLITNEMLNSELQQLWEVDEPQESCDLKPEDRWVVDEFKTHHYRNDSGGYVVTIPIKANWSESAKRAKLPCGNSYGWSASAYKILSYK